MLRRLLISAALAASTLLVTGAAQAAGPGACASAQRLAHGTTVTKQQCMWRGDCYYCYSYRTGRWDVQHCDGGGDLES
ncbi:hypothetical protein [Nonomuraea jiangxiensis]|uniref:Uncharacterized protein n=1 Tax=Nonomuraea jiangxiensis TaxID=633440 RepID=A0A1G9F161_9ACTN|nr:hypothetical protein [Nonomuraea jiangxiensis]SDK81995.1 hypothetical protein SAMN05421869_11977 [Nonomuraea jiangxiensis]